jgi:hypothetical protein
MLSFDISTGFQNAKFSILNGLRTDIGAPKSLFGGGNVSAANEGEDRFGAINVLSE